MKRRKDTQVGRKNAVEEDVPETQKEIASAKVLMITVSRIIEIRGTEDRIGSQGRRLVEEYTTGLKRENQREKTCEMILCRKYSSRA